MKTEVTRLISEVQKRHTFVLRLKLLLFSSLFVAVVLLFSILLWRSYRLGAISFALVGSCLTLILQLYFERVAQLTRVEAALELDHFCQAKERFTSCEDISQQNKVDGRHELIEKQLEQVIAQQQLNLGQIVPLDWKPRHSALLILNLLLWILVVTLLVKSPGQIGQLALGNTPLSHLVNHKNEELREEIDRILEKAPDLPEQVKSELETLQDILSEHELGSTAVADALQNAEAAIDSVQENQETLSSESSSEQTASDPATPIPTPAVSPSPSPTPEPTPPSEEQSEQEEQSPGGKDEETQKKDEQGKDQEEKSSQESEQKEQGQEQSQQNKQAEDTKESESAQQNDKKEGEGDGSGKGSQSQEGKSNQEGENNQGSGGKASSDQQKQQQEGSSDGQEQTEQGGQGEQEGQKQEGSEQNASKDGKSEQQEGSDSGAQGKSGEQEQSDKQGEGQPSGVQQAEQLVESLKQKQQAASQDQAGQQPQPSQEKSKEDSKESPGESGKGKEQKEEKKSEESSREGQPGDPSSSGEKAPQKQAPKEERSAPNRPNNKSGQGELTKNLPEAESSAQRYIEDGQEPMDNSLGGKQQFKEQQVREGIEKVDTRYTESTGQVVQHKGGLAARKDIAVTELAKPDPIEGKQKQQIPLEYADVLNQ